MNALIFPILGEEEHFPIYVIGNDSTENLINISRPNGYPYFMFIYCTSGKGKLEYSDHTLTYIKNNWVFMPSFTPCKFSALSSPCKLKSVIFDGCDIKNLLNHLNLSRPLVICPKEDTKPAEIISQITGLLKENIYLNGQKNSVLIYSLAIELSIHNKHHICKKEDTKKNLLLPIIQYIYENYNKSITLEELSDIVSISPQYICKLFKEYFEVRPFEYISKVRIQCAKRLLISTAKTINEISEEIGYKDCSYFCAVFKRYEKLTPAEFRNNFRYIID